MKETAKILKLIFSDKFSETEMLRLEDQFWNDTVTQFLKYPSQSDYISDFLKDKFEEIRFTKEAIHLFYLKFIDELAENYVLNEDLFENELEELIKQKDFLEKVDYYKAMKLAIQDSERKRIKNEFDIMLERLDFEIEDEKIEKSIQIHSRKELKKKFRQWDKETDDKKVIPLNPEIAASKENPEKYKSKSFSWLKLAVAASVVLFAGFVVFQLIDNKPSPQNPQFVIDKKDTVHHYKKEKEIDEPILKTEIKLAQIQTQSKEIEILEPSSLGYTGNINLQISVNLVSHSERIESLDKAFQETQNPEYQTEIKYLKDKQGKYIFDTETLEIFDSKWKQDDLKVLKSENEFYLYVESEKSFYKLEIVKSKKPQALFKVTDENLIETLDKILFENE